MKIIRKLEDIPPLHLPVVLTIGYFDGIHLGHQAILRRVIETAIKQGQQSAVLTFSNHPSTILHPKNPVENLYSIEQKIQFIDEIGIDFLILIHFDSHIAKMNAEEFLDQLRRAIPFSHLILGHDAKIGYQKKGDQKTLEVYAKKTGFYLEYLPPKKVDDLVVSSSLIRKMIADGDLKTAAKFLGRKV